jgi:hypothetical protein
MWHHPNWVLGPNWGPGVLLWRYVTVGDASDASVSLDLKQAYAVWSGASRGVGGLRADGERPAEAARGRVGGVVE